MNCENCNNIHDGNYGSGRFCNAKCARGFSTKQKRKEINEKVSKSLKGRKGAATPWSEETRNKISETWIKKAIEADFESLSFGTQRKVVIHEQGNKCSKCSIHVWQGQSLPLEIDHINGIRDDNRRENLEALCPNCHSITLTKTTVLTLLLFTISN